MFSKSTLHFQEIRLSKVFLTTYIYWVYVDRKQKEGEFLSLKALKSQQQETPSQYLQQCASGAHPYIRLGKHRDLAFGNRVRVCEMVVIALQPLKSNF